MKTNYQIIKNFKEMEQNLDVDNNVDKQANQNLPENNDGSMITPESEMMSDDGEESTSILEAKRHTEDLKKKSQKWTYRTIYLTMKRLQVWTYPKRKRVNLPDELVKDINKRQYYK